jgi:flagellar protein FliO/FliZ
VNASSDLAVLGRVATSLVVVVVLAVLAARLARKAGTRGDGIGLRVLDRTGLSREAAVAVVEVAGRGLVLGVTARGVAVLTELDADELAAARTSATAPARSVRTTVVEGVTVRPRPGTPPVAAARATRVTRPAGPAGAAGSGSVLDPRTWRQGVEALRELTVRRG